MTCSQKLYDHMHVAKQSCVLWNDHKWLIELKSWAVCLLRFVSSPLLSASKSTAQFFNILFYCVSTHKSITGSLTCEGWPFAIYLKCTVCIDRHDAWTTLIFYFLVFSKFSCSIHNLKSRFSFFFFFLNLYLIDKVHLLNFLGHSIFQYTLFWYFQTYLQSLH